MSIPQSRSYRNGKRGRHKHKTSPETKRWNREFLLPAQPPWMETDVYRRLVELRARL
jgi:hypothetical protein